MKDINHQRQPNYDTSTATCLAMLLDIPAKEVIAEFQEDWMSGKTNPAEYLSSKGLKFELHRDTYDNRLQWGKRYLVAAPSINVRGDFHRVIVDLSAGEGNVRVYDPNQGNLERSYYVPYERDEEEQTILTKWKLPIVTGKQ